VVVENGRQSVYVPVRPICDFLGVNWDGQRRRIDRDAVLAEAVTACVVVTTTQGQPDQRRTMLCLPLRYISGFLFGINASRVKPELKERLIMYQRECYDVLADAFLNRSPGTAVTSSEANLIQIREMGRAIMQMAQEQIEFDRRLATTESRIDKAGKVVGDLTKRVTTIEQHLATGDPVTDEQASQVSEAVKAIAMATPEKNFGKIYGELYRRFGITSYKLLPAARFAAAMAFLTEWYVNVSGDEETPF